MKPFIKIITGSLIASAIIFSSLQSSSQIIRTRNVYYSVNAFAVTPDGKSMALGGKNRLEIMNAVTGELLAAKMVTSPVKALDFSREGRFLIVSYDSRDAGVNLSTWDIASGYNGNIVHSHKDRILAVAISPNGEMFATGSKDKTIKIYETKSYKEVVTLMGHKGSVTCLRFSPDNKFLLSGSEDNTMKLWDLEKKIDLHTFSAHSKQVNSVAFSPDARYLASGGDDSYIIVWDIYDTKKPVANLKAHSLGITGIEFTPDGRFLGSASKDRLFYIWDYLNEKRLYLNFGTGVNHTDAINYISFVENGRLYTCSSDETIKYWNWGFPILETNNFKITDKNNNQKIEGSEEVKIRFNIQNKGEGSALRLKFNINEVRNIEGLTYPRDFTIEEIPARSTYEVAIPVKASAKLKSTEAKFVLSNFTSISNFPFQVRDTSLVIETVATPFLLIDTVYFTKSDTSRFLSGKEAGTLKIHLRNYGVGVARDLKVNLSSDNPSAGLIFEKQTDFGLLGVYSSVVLNIPVKASQKTADGVVNFRIDVSDASGISTASATYQIATKKYESTIVEEIKEAVELKINEWQKKGKYEKTENYVLRVTDKTRQAQIAAYTQQTIDSIVRKQLNWALASNEYDADNESFRITIPGFDPVVIKIPNSEAPEFDRRFATLEISDMKYTINALTNRFAFVHLGLTDTLSGNKLYSYDSKELVAFTPTQLDFNFEPVNINIPSSSMAVAGGNETKRLTIGRSDVDLYIPQVVVENPNVYAVVVGNEDYKRYQNDLRSESNVDYAELDAEAFYNYLLKTYGVPKENIRLRKNATGVQMNQDISWLRDIAAGKRGEAELVYYYSGHGLPDEISGDGYVIPVDVTGTNLGMAIKLSNLYSELSKYPTKKVTVFLDACFSGGGRNESLLALKKVKIKPKDETISGNMVVFTSSSGEESSGFYKEKQHGLFTYYLLKKMQETNGEADYQSMIDYLKQEVNLKSLIYNNKSQNPQIIISQELSQPLSQLKLGSRSAEPDEQVDQ